MNYDNWLALQGNPEETPEQPEVTCEGWLRPIPCTEPIGLGQVPCAEKQVFEENGTLIKCLCCGTKIHRSELTPCNNLVFVGSDDPCSDCGLVPPEEN